MTYIELCEQLKDFPFFSLRDIRLLEPDFDRRRLSEWQTKDYIHKISRGYYQFGNRDLTDLDLFCFANQLFKPSYISMESALRYYNFIPEAVYAITSVSSVNTKTYNTSLATFSYQKIRAQCFNNYKVVEFHNRAFKIANPEKALVDFLYLRSDLDTIDAIEGLRLDRDEILEQIDIAKLDSIGLSFGSQALRSRIVLLKGYLNNA